METLQELAEAYAEQENLHTENGKYTKTTIINAFNDGAKAMLQSFVWSLVSNNIQKGKSPTEEDRKWLIEQINNKV